MKNIITVELPEPMESSSLSEIPMTTHDASAQGLKSQHSYNAIKDKALLQTEINKDQKKDSDLNGNNGLSLEIISYCFFYLIFY